MLDGIFRSNFRTKCKSLLNRIKTRLEVIKQRRIAMQKFLKKDIAELLKNNHDLIAYGSRADGLYKELMSFSSYEFVEQCCAFITQNLKEMHKKSECPEQCRVAVASLIYAAARLADLPELRDLRNHFIDKYGKTIESFVQKEFMETLNYKPPTTQMKLQLMQEIAHEFSVTWDSSNLERQLRSPSSLTRETAKSASENGVNGVDRNWFRNRSTVGPEKGKQVDNNKEKAVMPNTRRHYSCTDFNENVTDKIQDRNHLQEETFQENNSLSKPKPRPKSVRTKFLKPSARTDHDLITSATSSEVDPRESLSARVTREKGNDLFSDKDEEEEMFGKLSTYLGGKTSLGSSSARKEEEEEMFGKLSTYLGGKTPLGSSSARKEEEEEMFGKLSTYLGGKTPLGSSSARKEDNGTPKMNLPPPPFKRRYLTPNSAPSSPTMKANNLGRKSVEKSKILTPEEQKSEMVKASIRHVRSNSEHPAHPKLHDSDELTEMFAMMNNM